MVGHMGGYWSRNTGYGTVSACMQTVRFHWGNVFMPTSFVRNSSILTRLATATLLLLAACATGALMTQPLWPTAHAQQNKGDFPPGDINQDGQVNAIDIQLAINAFHENPSDSPADVNGDSRVDALDIQRVINVALGIAQ